MRSPPPARSAQFDRGEQRGDALGQVHRDGAERLIAIRAREFELEAREGAGLRACVLRANPGLNGSGLPAEHPSCDREFFGGRGQLTGPVPTTA